MIIETVLTIIFVLICIGDCYSTIKLMKHNKKLITDKKYKRKCDARIRKETKDDASKFEMSNFGSKLMRKYGVDRTMAYIGVFGYGPLSLFLFWNLLVGDVIGIMFTIALISFLFGVLYKQVWVSLTLKRRFGINIWREEI